MTLHDAAGGVHGEAWDRELPWALARVLDREVPDSDCRQIATYLEAITS